VRYQAAITTNGGTTGGGDWKPDVDNLVETAWTTAPLFSKIDEGIDSLDSELITGDPADQGNQNYRAEFEPVTDPGHDVGHSVLINAARDGSGADNPTIFLTMRNGGTDFTIGNVVLTSTTFGTTEFTISDANFALITDFSALRVELRVDSASPHDGHALVDALCIRTVQP